MRLNENSKYRIDLVDQNSIKNPYSKGFVNKMNIHWSSKNIGFQSVGFGPELYNFMKITGQRPCVTLSQKGVAQLGVRKDSMAGIKMTLRGRNIYRFKKQLNQINLNEMGKRISYTIN